MFHELQHARIEGPVRCVTGGSRLELPQGPCLMEHVDNRRVDIVWGDRGEHSAQVLISEIRRASDSGDFVVLA